MYNEITRSVLLEVYTVGTHISILTKTNSHKLLKYLIYFCAICGPLLTLPQIYNIWLHKNSQGIAVTSWVGYLVIAFIWIIYGAVYKNKSVLLSSSLWVIVECFVIAEALHYR